MPALSLLLSYKRFTVPHLSSKLLRRNSTRWQCRLTQVFIWILFIAMILLPTSTYFIFQSQLITSSEIVASGDAVLTFLRGSLQESGHEHLKDSGHEHVKALEFKDLVLGMAQDIDPKNFAVFCKSLRSVSSTEAVVLMNAPISERHLQLAKVTGVTIKEFTLDKVQPQHLQRYHPSTLRWHLFNSYLLERNETYALRRILTLDVRDSYFQSDPFAFISPSMEPANSSLHVFYETQAIQECGWNTGWVRDCFGEQVVQSIGGQTIVCSGVTAGSAAAVTEYMRTMNSVMSGHAPNISTLFPQCERNGVDQGVHNVLVHTGALDHLNLRRWNQTVDSPVVHMQTRSAMLNCTGLAEQEECEVRNHVGLPVAVVHQYDRYPQLQKYLFRKYVDWVKTGDLKAEWEDELACRATYTYQADTDLFKGMCDIPHKGGVTSAAACCALCDARRDQGCQAFTFLEGTCYFKSCGKAGTNGLPIALIGAVSGYMTV